MNELQSTNLLDLPNEILLEILTFLPLNYIKAVRQTCSRLYQISQSKEIWKKQHFLFYFSSEYKDEEDMLNWLIKADPPYLNLEINFHRTYVIEEVILKITRLLRFLGPKIGSLLVYGIVDEVPFSMIEDIMLTCVSLKELKLYGLHCVTWPRATRITPECTHTKLEILELSLNLCSTIIIDTLLSFYPFIKTFIVDYIFLEGYNWNLDLEFTKFLVNKIRTTNKLIENLKFESMYGFEGKKLNFTSSVSSKLRLRSIYLGKDQKLFSRAEFKRIFSKQNNLREIMLEDSELFNDEYLRDLKSHCPKLESLKIYSKCNISIFELSTKLKVLELSDAKLSKRNTIDPLFPNLEQVCLHNCFSQDGANGFQFLENCRLRVLNLNECAPLQDTDILRIVSASEDTLVDLCLITSEKFSNLEEISIVHLSKLETLNINASDDITQAIVNDFNFPWLKFISIHSYEIEEQRFKMMTTSCPLLEDVFLEFDSKIDDNTLLLLSKRFHFLRSLYKLGSVGGKRLFSNRKYEN